MDRNIILPKQLDGAPPSLSARRAWIEMLESKQIDPSVMVALRKESVDRNVNNAEINKHNKLSLSARRAWIEIATSLLVYLALIVALRKESVDRNIWVDKTQSAPRSRSPQGERG